jgi:hypothetical protein
MDTSRRLPVNKLNLLIPLALLAAAALACSPSAPSLPANTALYKDDFSDSGSGWCVDSTANSSLDYLNGEYVFKVVKDNWFVWCNPGQNLGDIHIEVTARDVSNTSDTTFGVICNDQKAAEQTDEALYYLGFRPDGHYTIALSKGGQDQVLTKGTSNSIPSTAISYTVGADCGGGHLTLYANGTKIASASDSTYTTGDVGLFAWTGDGAPAEVHYDNLVVTKLSTGTPTQ